MQTKSTHTGLDGSIIYEKSLVFAKKLYLISERSDDDFIANEIRRSVTSIVTTIAESRLTLSYSKELGFLNSTLGYLHKSRALMDVLLVHSIIDYEKHQKLDLMAIEIMKMSITLMNRANQQIKTVPHYPRVTVTDFRKSYMYQRSIDMMQVLYWFVDSVRVERELCDEHSIYNLGVKIPYTIASAIGQVNMKVRFKMLNQAKVWIEKVNKFLYSVNGLSKEHQAERDKVKNCATQMLKMINSYFAFLKGSDKLKPNVIQLN